MDIKTLKDIGSYRSGDTIKVSKKLEYLSGTDAVTSIRITTDKAEELTFNKSEYESIKEVSIEP